MLGRASGTAAVLALSVSLAMGADFGPDAKALTAARTKAINFLKTAQAADGSWTSDEAPGVTGLVAYSLLLSGVSPDDPQLHKALKHLESFKQPDGGIYLPKSNHANYETSIVMLALQAANQDGRYTAELKQAEAFVRGLQWDESEGTDRTDPKYGGQGYGRNKDRPDLSNTMFFLEALEANGAKKDDPAVQKALVFLSRCQNLESEFNTTPPAAKVNDGGFYYTPALGGQSPAGQTPEGGLRSYGNMTYAGFKSMIFAGLDKKDPRMKAAWDWIQKFYNVKENPGMGQAGLYYYFQVFAKAMAANQEDVITDGQGQKHDWRKELAEHIFSLQQENGGWLNSTPRWMEGDPNLATAYVLIALHYTAPK
ncbi:MAG: prenyltransferase/squalene oxidase repeat-containing protein [Planctomycetaceae bacterium]